MKDWDLKKKAAFTKAMKKPRFAKGGLIRKVGNRKYFDDGGQVTTLGGPTSVGVQNASNPNTGILGTLAGGIGLNNNFQATGANIQPGTNAAQLNEAYTGAQNAIANQSNLAGTLTPQAANAVANQNDLANQYSAMTRGEGPNPALAQLHQATGANVANTAALMAGQRGASANPGLIAREAAMQGANIQQNAIGQAATLQAEQQIAAQNNLANLAGTQIGQTGQAVTGLNTAQQNEQNILQGANTAANNATVGMQSNINNVNANTAKSNQSTAGSLFGGITSAISGAFGGLNKGGVVGEDEQEMEEHLKLAQMNAESISHGKKKYAEGGQISPNPLIGRQANPAPQANWAGQYMNSGPQGGPNIESTQSGGEDKDYLSGPGAKLGKALKGKGSTFSDGTAGPWETGGGMAGGAGDSMGSLASGAEMFAYEGGDVHPGPHNSHVANYLFAEGGEVKAMVSPGEVYLSPENVRKVIHEGANPMKVGKKIKGKAPVKGDSLKNDIVDMDLEEGGVVIPRHITKHKMAPEKAELFVHRALARKKARR